MRAALLSCAAALCAATPPIPDPYDTGCAAQKDCESCLATQVPGPVPLPGLKQNCGWCFKTGECHDDIQLSAAKCALYCTAKRLPAFDGPVCPSNSCDPPKYTCIGGKCTKTGDQKDGNGTSIELCEVECAIAPPPAAVQYQCASGQCVQSPSGIALDVCQQLCNPQPPAPAGAQYQCASGKCTESATGIDLQTCQALCHPPAPSPPSPSGPMYQCASGKCTESATGIDLQTCQGLCHPPAPSPPQPPAPTPPSAQYQCASGKCTESATGIDLQTCQALCHPPAPVPPAPSKYQCITGACTATATGIDLDTCQAVCH